MPCTASNSHKLHSHIHVYIVLGTSSDSQYHIGYYRDVPSHAPVFVASNEVGKGCKLNILGDNLLAALHSHLQTSEYKVKGKSVSNLYYLVDFLFAVWMVRKLKYVFAKMA